MRSKLYKLAIWYIGKCNSKWDKPTKEIKSLDRLTYRNVDKAYLSYGADAEWRSFSRYDVLDNAIQRLAEYEEAEFKKEQEIRANAIDEFAEALEYRLANDYRHLLTIDEYGFEWLTTDAVRTHIDEIAEQMKAGE